MKGLRTLLPATLRKRGAHLKLRNSHLAIPRAIIAGGFVASALFTAGIGVAATSAGADSGSTVTGSPFNGSDGVLDATPTGVIHQTPDLPSGASDNIFGGAPAAKEEQTCPTTAQGPLPPKTDLTDFWIGEAKGASGTSYAQNDYLYLAWKRVATSGNANIDFELNQSTLAPTCVSATANMVRTPGDLLIQYNFQSTGGAVTLSVYNWVTSGSCDIGSWSSYGGCWRVRPLTQGAEEASVSSDYSFGEAVINLQASAIFAPGVCESLASAFAKSRSSEQATADLKDYIAPAGVAVQNCSPTSTQTTPSATVVPTNGSLTDSVTVTGNSTQGPPSGSVTFYVCSGATTGCDPATGTQLTGVNPVSLTLATGTGADTSTATSPSYTPPGPGNYCFAGVYTPTAGNLYQSSSDTSVDECFTEVSPATVSTTVKDQSGNTVTDAAPAPLGTAVHDTATFANGFRPITGDVTYALYPDGSCAGTSPSSETVTVGPGSVIPDSSPQTLVAGSYSYKASYSGDGSNAAAVADCEPFSVSKAQSGTSTVVFDNATGHAWSGTEITGAQAYDTAQVTGISGFTPTGTVVYTFFTNGTCTGDPSTTETVSLSGGQVPGSAATAALTPGNYGFLADYSGDSNYSGSTEPCEAFAVGLAPTTMSTVVNDAGTGAAWTGNETVGAMAYDTATISGQQDQTPTGTVSYRFFTNGTCSGNPSTTDTVTLNSDGSVPDSSTTAALAAGSHSFLASYSGDSNYAASTAACEPFAVAQASSAIATTVFDNATSSTWSGTETAGAEAYDTSTVTGVDGFAPTGTVTYKLFTNGSCSTDSPLTTETVDLSEGSVPNSSPTEALAAGSYSYLTSYSGDSNYAGSTASCEPFSVLVPPMLTAVKSSNPPDGSTVQPGDSVTYTITLTNSGEVDATGVTVTDAVPGGTTFLSAGNGGQDMGGTVTWAGLTVPAGGSTAVSFIVRVEPIDTGGEVISNVASFTNENTPDCGDAATCSTNTVKLTVASEATTRTAPTTTTTTTTTTAPAITPARHTVTPTAPPHGLAFTGSDTFRAAGVGLGGLLLGGFLVALSRRRRSA